MIVSRSLKGSTCFNFECGCLVRVDVDVLEEGQQFSRQYRLVTFEPCINHDGRIKSLDVRSICVDFMGHETFESIQDLLQEDAHMVHDVVIETFVDEGV